MIVKKCPAKTGENGCISSETSSVECSKNKECIMKQLIKKINNKEVLEFLGII